MVINNQSALKAMLNNIVAIVIAILTAFWLSACSVSPAVPEQKDSTVTTSKTDSMKTGSAQVTTIDPFAYRGCVSPPAEYVQACTTKGGVFSQQGRLGCHMCVVNYADAGKACKDSSDCQGSCQSSGEFIASGTANQTGQCSANSSPFGCRQTIEKGVAQPAICVD